MTASAEATHVVGFSTTGGTSSLVPVCTCLRGFGTDSGGGEFTAGSVGSRMIDGE